MPQKQRSFTQALKRLFAYLGPYTGIVVLSILCTLLVTGVKLSQAHFIGRIFGLMSGQLINKETLAALQKVNLATDAMTRLNNTCLLFLAAMLIMGLLTYVMRYLINKGGQLATRDMRNHVFAHIQRLPMSFFDQMRLGEIQSRACGDVTAATSVFTQLADLSVNLTLVVLSLSYMLYKDLTMTLVVMALSPFIGITISKFGKRIGNLTESIQARSADLSAITYEGISHVKGIKAYSLEKLQTDRFEDKSNEAYRFSMDLVKISACQSPVVDFLGALGIVVIVWLGAYRIIQGQVTFEQMTVYWTLLVMTSQPINALSVFYSNFRAAGAAAERVFYLLDQDTEEQLNRKLPDLPAIQGSISFENVVFSYSQEKPILKGINLQVKPGEVIAIVGSNGAGKTTLINLLARFYDPQEGCVKIDDYDLKHYNAESLRQQIALVTQESILLGGSIADNIGMGCKDSTQDKIVAAAKLANAHEFIIRLPQGYQSEVGERGSRLSGGQCQRIAIARALLRNPPILALDEFTSGIDPESEILITDAIEKSLQGRTCLIIAHRFNTIRNAHRIIVMDEGEIVESGNHEQLMANNGLYRRIYQAQLQAKESEVLSQVS